MVKKLVALLVILAMLSAPVLAGEVYFKARSHSHDPKSDGLVSEDVQLKNSVSNKVKVFLMTNHLLCLVGRCSNVKHHHPKQDFSEEYFRDRVKEDKGTFLVRDAEINTNFDNVHLLYLNIDPRNARDTGFKNLDWRTPEEIISWIHAHNGLAVFAHPHWYKKDILPGSPDALEFFNTRGFELTQIKNLKLYEAAEKRDLAFYCQAIKKYLSDYEHNKLPAIIGGSDCHLIPEELFFGNTLFRAEQPVPEAFYRAIKEGKTYAILDARQPVKIEKLNYHPQLRSQAVGQICLEGLITLAPSPLKADKFFIYRDGELAYSKTIKTTTGDFSFAFKEENEPGRHVCLLYIPNRFITSPIVFDVQKPSNDTPSVRVTYNRAPDVSPDGQRIAFVSNRDGNDEIYIMRIDGTAQERVTYDAGQDISPVWVADSERLVFSSDRGGKRNIWLYNSKIGATECLTSHFPQDCFSPCAQHEQNLIIFTKGDRACKIYFFSLPPYQIEEPSDSDTFIYAKGSNQIVSGTVNRQNENLITQESANCNSCGQLVNNWLVYSTNSNGKDYDIWWVDTSTRHKEPLVYLPGDQETGKVFGEGANNYVVFDSNHLGSTKQEYEIFLFNRETKEITRLTYSADPHRRSQVMQEEFARKQLEENRKIQEEEERRRKEEEQRVRQEILNRALETIFRK